MTVSLLNLKLFVIENIKGREMLSFRGIRLKIKKRYKIWLFFLTYSSHHTLAFETMELAQSLFVVIANPSNFYHKKIIVSGFSTSGYFIYPTKELSKFGITKNGLPLDIKDSDKFKTGYISVVGTLCKTKNTVPYLCNITRITQLSWDKDVVIHKQKLIIKTE